MSYEPLNLYFLITKSEIVSKTTDPTSTMVGDGPTLPISPDLNHLVLFVCEGYMGSAQTQETVEGHSRRIRSDLKQVE